MRNAGLEETQTGIKIARRNINKLRYSDETTLMAESEEELKNLLMSMKEESKNAGLKLSIKKASIMTLASKCSSMPLIFSLLSVFYLCLVIHPSTQIFSP